MLYFRMFSRDFDNLNYDLLLIFLFDYLVFFFSIKFLMNKVVFLFFSFDYEICMF